jgi:hypothetical protein
MKNMTSGERRRKAYHGDEELEQQLRIHESGAVLRGSPVDGLLQIVTNGRVDLTEQHEVALDDLEFRFSRDFGSGVKVVDKRSEEGA